MKWSNPVSAAQDAVAGYALIGIWLQHQHMDHEHVPALPTCHAEQRLYLYSRVCRSSALKREEGSSEVQTMKL